MYTRMISSLISPKSRSQLHFQTRNLSHCSDSYFAPREMSVITPSRVELLPIHNPYFGPLQPSAMPLPPPSISPHPAAPFNPPPKLDKSRIEQFGANHYDTIASWRKGLDGNPRPNPSTRSVLAEVRPNTALNASASSSASTRFISKSTTTRLSAALSIPRPAPIPDVFAPSLNASFPSRTTSLSNLSGKRSRDPGGASLSVSKRVKVDEKRELAEATARSHKLEEEKWRAKWVKVFPTLVFHFEIGAEEGQGKSLVGRVTRMGAVSDAATVNAIDD